MGCAASMLETTGGVSDKSYPAGDLRPTKSTNVLAKAGDKDETSIDNAEKVVPNNDPLSFQGDTKSEASDSSLNDLLEIAVRSDFSTPDLSVCPVTEHFSISHIGAKNMATGVSMKSENQDVVSACFPFNSREHNALFCVFDGHGSDGLTVICGYLHGEVTVQLQYRLPDFAMNQFQRN